MPNPTNKKTAEIIVGLLFFTMFIVQKGHSTNRETIIGNPPVYHFSHTDYNSDSQFWTACQDRSGIMYLGNNSGILRFDGERWERATLPNNSSVRSLFCASDGTIYAGGFNEFGTIRDNLDGSFSYHSLINNLPDKYKDFGNIWKIVEKDDVIIFQSFNYLCFLNNGNYKIIEPASYFGYVGLCHDQLFVLDQNTLFTLDVHSAQFTPFLSTEALNHEEIVNILPADSKNLVLIVTKAGSLFTANILTKKIEDHNHLTIGGNEVFTSALKSTSGIIYTGTLSHKMYSWQIRENQIKQIRNFSALQDKTVLNLFESREGLIWVLLNKGLDFIDPNAPLTLLFQGSSIYDAVLSNNQLFIATNQGVFSSSRLTSDSILKQNDVTKIHGLEGQAWSLKAIGDKLFCAHDRGLFHIMGKRINRVGEYTGVWKLYPVSGSDNLYFVCTYNGLGMIRVTSEGIEVIHEKIAGFDESTRDLMSVPHDSHSYWVCHGYKGVFKINTNATHSRIVSTEHFHQQNGLPSPFNINVHRWRGMNIFSTNHGLYVFDKERGKFIVHTEMTHLLGQEKNIRQIIENGDTTWCIIDDQIAFIDHANANKVILDPFLSLKGTLNRGMECIVPVKGSNEVLIGTTNGLFAFKPASSPIDGSADGPSTQIRRLSYNMKDSTVLRRVDLLNSPFVFPNEVYNVQFQLSAPGIKDKTNIRYAFRLEGQMDQWSQWQEKPDVSFSFLKSGNYTLIVKAKSLSGELANPTQFSFIIESAWYATWPWIIFWVAVGLTIVFSLFKQIQKIILKEKEKTRAEEQKLQKAREIELENQIIMREKQRIEAENIEKSKDLVNNTLLVAKMRELLIDLQTELNNIRKNAKNDSVRKSILNMVRNIQISLNDERQYQLFDTNLERVHQELFNNLKSRYPTITAKELRLCAFIKMELTNKEMASIFNISVRGVETARYRLKKKHSGINELLGLE
ncbi:triple tyrosine motif-containing protein [Thermophagus sp. OGC60D27]|uniref:triple tyrosine motif-containing protein n=1 Tax=Thermophagus sp. OGC60D27 TaxID=3458415 RepID=UPI0040376D78